MEDSPCPYARVVAVMVGTTVSYLLTDHLGSTANTINTSGTETGELRFKAWEENRHTSGSTPTTLRFTGQRQESSQGGSLVIRSGMAEWNTLPVPGIVLSFPPS